MTSFYDMVEAYVAAMDARLEATRKRHQAIIEAEAEAMAAKLKSELDGWKDRHAHRNPDYKNGERYD